MNTNPVLEVLRDHLPCRTVYCCTLRRPGSPLILNLKRPGKCRFIRREDFEPADVDVSVRSMEVTRDEIHTITPPWKHIEEVEEWLEESGWSLGAWDMVRYSMPPEADPECWRENPGNGIGVNFCGLDAVYFIPGSTGKPDEDNWEWGDVAAREGWWSWVFKPTVGWPSDSIEFKLGLRGDVRLRPDGSREPPFPGWLRTDRYAGRSGDWWLGLAKSFETADAPGTALRIVWDFRKRMLGLRS